MLYFWQWLIIKMPVDPTLYFYMQIKCIDSLPIDFWHHDINCVLITENWIYVLIVDQFCIRRQCLWPSTVFLVRNNELFNIYQDTFNSESHLLNFEKKILLKKDWYQKCSTNNFSFFFARFKDVWAYFSLQHWLHLLFYFLTKNCNW